MSDVASVRLHVVTGKGGTGKTTVAAALALALAAGGRQVLLAEVEGRQGIAQLFDVPPLPYDERRVAVAPEGGELYALAVDPEEALLDYLEMFYKIKSTGVAARSLRRIGAVDFATTVAPGMRDVLLTGKVKEAAVRRPEKHRGRTYDAVVLDAPPSGRIGRFLGVTAEVAGLAKVGPIKTQSEGVIAMLRSTQTAVHIVTLLEDMPVQESIDTVAELRAAHLPVGAVIVNMVREPMLAPADLAAAARGELDTGELARGLKDAGLDLADEVVGVLAAEAGEHARRVELEEHERDRLAALDRPIYELPALPDAVDLGGLYCLAGLLIEQGMR